MHWQRIERQAGSRIDADGPQPISRGGSGTIQMGCRLQAEAPPTGAAPTADDHPGPLRQQSLWNGRF